MMSRRVSGNRFCWNGQFARAENLLRSRSLSAVFAGIFPHRRFMAAFEQEFLVITCGILRVVLATRSLTAECERRGLRAALREIRIRSRCPTAGVENGLGSNRLMAWRHRGRLVGHAGSVGSPDGRRKNDSTDAAERLDRLHSSRSSQWSV